MSKKVTKTLEYDAEGRVIKETSVEESTDAVPCLHPHYPCTRQHVPDYHWYPYSLPKVTFGMHTTNVKGNTS